MHFNTIITMNEGKEIVRLGIWLGYVIKFQVYQTERK